MPMTSNLWTTIEVEMSGRSLPIPHPGAILREEFLDPMGLSAYALAQAIQVPRSRINEICRGRQGISANIALRLGKFFSVDPQWFLNMQAKYDLETERERLKADLAAITPREPESVQRRTKPRISLTASILPRAI